MTHLVRHDRHRQPGHDIALVGHGTAWTLLWAVLRDGPPDREWWVCNSPCPTSNCVDLLGRDDMLNT